MTGACWDALVAIFRATAGEDRAAALALAAEKTARLAVAAAETAPSGADFFGRVARRIVREADAGGELALARTLAELLFRRRLLESADVPPDLSPDEDPGVLAPPEGEAPSPGARPRDRGAARARRGRRDRALAMRPPRPAGRASSTGDAGGISFSTGPSTARPTARRSRFPTPSPSRSASRDFSRPPASTPPGTATPRTRVRSSASSRAPDASPRRPTGARIPCFSPGSGSRTRSFASRTACAGCGASGSPERSRHENSPLRADSARARRRPLRLVASRAGSPAPASPEPVTPADFVASIADVAAGRNAAMAEAGLVLKRIEFRLAVGTETKAGGKDRGPAPRRRGVALDGDGVPPGAHARDPGDRRPQGGRAAARARRARVRRRGDEHRARPRPRVGRGGPASEDPVGRADREDHALEERSAAASPRPSRPGSSRRWAPTSAAPARTRTRCGCSSRRPGDSGRGGRHPPPRITKEKSGPSRDRFFIPRSGGLTSSLRGWRPSPSWRRGTSRRAWRES